MSGAGSSSIGIAGSVAINIVNDTTQASSAANAVLSAGGGDTGFSATDTASVTTSATPENQTAPNGKFGLGASVALAIVNDSVVAELGNGTTLIGANNLSLSATSSDTVATTAQMGSSGSVAITPSIAISIVHNTTKADLGTVGTTPLAVGGNLTVSAMHTGNTSDSAMANATGESAAIGAGLALTFATDTTTATTSQNITATAAGAGAITFQAFNTGAATASAAASSAGAPNSDQSSTPSVDSQISNETSAGAGDAPSGTNTTTSTPPSASASDGNSSSGTKISVAAAIAVNASSSTAQATIPANMVIDASGLLTLASSNTTTGSATATGGAVTSGSSGIAIGAAVAVNYDPAINEATIATGDTITAKGVTLSAINTGANSPTDAFTATTQSGAGGGKIGIAGSVAINIVNDTTEALISPNAAVNAGGGDVTMTAADAATVTTSATPSVDTTGTKFGLGASVALAIVNDSVTAELGNGATLTEANNLSLSAHLFRHRRDDGADGIIGIGRDHALDRHLDRPQHDESRSGNRGNRAAGDRRQFDGLRGSHRQHVRLRDGQRNRRERGHRRGARLDVRHRYHHRDDQPEHHGDSGRSGSDHLPGLQYRRGHGECRRERGGAPNSDQSSTPSVDSQISNETSAGAGDAPSGTNTTTSTPPSASASDGNSSSGTKISVAAAIAVNASSSTAQATIPANMVIDASGLLTLASSNTTTGSATATGGAVTSGSSGIAIGAAVAVNYDPAINEATIATGDTITAEGVTLSAINTGANSPTDAFTATTQSGAGGGKIGIAGSVAINIVNDTTEALISPSAAVNAGGGDVTMTAADAATVTTSATPSVDTTGTKFGLGASVALAIVNDSVTAELGNGATLTGANNLSLSAQPLPTPSRRRRRWDRRDRSRSRPRSPSRSSTTRRKPILEPWEPRRWRSAAI